MKIDLATLSARASKAEGAQRQFFKKIPKARLNRLDEEVHEAHATVFREIDCLECANCCRTLGPRITDRDIDKMALSLRMRPSEVVAAHLRVDEDGDYVFRTMPCPFLADDNYCLIYADRPKACREYPHTDRKKFSQLISLTIHNAKTCPAVFEILEQLRLGLSK